MAVSAQFDIFSLGILTPLEALQSAGEDLTPLMDVIGRVLVNGARDRIAISNTDPDGVAWPQSLRVKEGGKKDAEGRVVESGGKTLYASGDLLNSIVSLPEARQVTVGSNLIYAGIHQTGGTIRAKTAGGLHFTLANGVEVVVGSVEIPRRTYIGISTEESEEIGDLTAAHFLGGAQ